MKGAGKKTITYLPRYQEPYCRGPPGSTGRSNQAMLRGDTLAYYPIVYSETNGFVSEVMLIKGRAQCFMQYKVCTAEKKRRSGRMGRSVMP